MPVHEHLHVHDFDKIWEEAKTLVLRFSCGCDNAHQDGGQGRMDGQIGGAHV